LAERACRPGFAEGMRALRGASRRRSVLPTLAVYAALAALGLLAARLGAAAPAAPPPAVTVVLGEDSGAFGEGAAPAGAGAARAAPAAPKVPAGRLDPVPAAAPSAPALAALPPPIPSAPSPQGPAPEARQPAGAGAARERAAGAIASADAPAGAAGGAPGVGPGDAPGAGSGGWPGGGGRGSGAGGRVPGAPVPLSAELAQVLSKPPRPAYPPMALSGRVQGVVLVEVTVDAQGVPMAAHALKGPGLLRGAAEACVLAYRFRPYLAAGIPTPFRTEIPCTFRLD
jgi:outer membrane biosynthesis protein TonB